MFWVCVSLDFLRKIKKNHCENHRRDFFIILNQQKIVILKIENSNFRLSKWKNQEENFLRTFLPKYTKSVIFSRSTFYQDFYFLQRIAREKLQSNSCLYFGLYFVFLDENDENILHSQINESTCKMWFSAYLFCIFCIFIFEENINILGENKVFQSFWKKLYIFLNAGSHAVRQMWRNRDWEPQCLFFLIWLSKENRKSLPENK